MGLFRIGKGLIKTAGGLISGDIELIVRGAADVGIGIVTSLVGNDIKDALEGTEIGDFLESIDIIS